MPPPDYNGLSDAEFGERLLAWLKAVYPPAWRDPLMRLRGDDANWWYRKQHEDGWRAPAWPREHGGLGLSLAKEIVYQEVTEAFGIARTHDHGVRLFGPILIKYGTDAQRRTYLEPILAGDITFCQGYSEPNAGSDLASLKTRATPTEGGFLINGQKTWTTQAADVTHIYLLARTSTGERKQVGITLFFLPIDTPGIRIRPIRNLLDEEEFFEVFFDEVFVPAENVVGEVDQGWRIAKALLGFERFSQGSPHLARHAMRLLREIVAALNLADDPRYADRLAALECDLHDSAALYRDLCAAVERGDEPQSEYSVAKLTVAELFQRVSDCLLDATGEADRCGPGLIPDDLRQRAEHAFLLARPVTIFGGTSQIQRDILARELLGR